MVNPRLKELAMNIEEELNLILSGTSPLLKSNIPLLVSIAQIVKHYTQETTNNQKDYYPIRKNKPKVKLYFKQDPKELINSQSHESPDEGELSFRLMDESSKTLLPNRLKNLALKIKSKFAKPVFKWKKGKNLLSYTDWDNGVQFQILCPNKTEGKKLVEQALDLIDLSPNWENANFIENLQPTKRYPKKRKKEIILGEQIELPERRKECTVIFRHAQIIIPGLPKPRYLIDLTGRKNNVVIPKDEI